jgi:hypothetical protein
MSIARILNHLIGLLVLVYAFFLGYMESSAAEMTPDSEVCIGCHRRSLQELLINGQHPSISPKVSHVLTVTKQVNRVLLRSSTTEKSSK